MPYTQYGSPFLAKSKPPAPSKKKSLGYYNKANPTGKIPKRKINETAGATIKYPVIFSRHLRIRRGVNHPTRPVFAGFGVSERLTS